MTSRFASRADLRDLARLRRVRDRIDREDTQPLDVQALARGANMSAGHVTREFRLADGESPYAYLWRFQAIPQAPSRKMETI